MVSFVYYSILGSIMPTLMQLDVSMANLSEWRVVQLSTQYNSFLCILQHPWFDHAGPDAAGCVYGQSVRVARGPTLRQAVGRYGPCHEQISHDVIRWESIKIQSIIMV